MMKFLNALLFASDAVLLVICGVGCLLLAGFASWMDRRRNMGRDLQRLEKVGWVPWTTVFVLSAIIGMGLLALSVPVVLGNQ
ncbi:MAG: hypothetical protein ABJP48_10970 [Erythrobacter sp.]